MGSPVMPPILNLTAPSPTLPSHDPIAGGGWGWRSTSSPCGFPRQNRGLHFPALPVSDHTPLAPPGELARQASLGAVPALSPLISRSVSRWIHCGVIKAINKFPMVGWTWHPLIPALCRVPAGPHSLRNNASLPPRKTQT